MTNESNANYLKVFTSVKNLLFNIYCSIDEVKTASKASAVGLRGLDTVS